MMEREIYEFEGVQYEKLNVCFINKGDTQELGYIYQRFGDNNVQMVMEQDEFLSKFEKLT